MRDDIHKSAPVNQGWRRVMQCCAREADRKERAAEAARKALLADFARETVPGRIKEMIDKCDSPKSDLFRGNLEGVRNDVNGGVIGQQIAEQVEGQARHNGGTLNSAALLNQLTNALEERKDSVGRAMRGHVLKAGGKGSAECNEAIRVALNSISAKECAAEIVANGGKALMPKKFKQSVSMDENLLR